jgi:hypothetical protein
MSCHRFTTRAETYSGEFSDDFVGSLERIGVALLVKLVLHHGPNTVFVLERAVSGWNWLASAVFGAVVLLD